MINNTYLFYAIPLLVLILGKTPHELSHISGGILKTKHCHVLRVLDGDTITVDCDGKEERVRLLYIDAPESDQLGPQNFYQIGKWSTARLKSRLSIFKLVSIKYYEKDTYGRVLGVVYHLGVNINLWMIQKGVATIYQYAEFESPQHKNKYYFELLKAAVNGEGIWSLDKWRNPYFFRRSKKLNKRLKKFLLK